MERERGQERKIERMSEMGCVNEEGTAYPRRLDANLVVKGSEQCWVRFGRIEVSLGRRGVQSVRLR